MNRRDRDNRFALLRILEYRLSASRWRCTMSPEVRAKVNRWMTAFRYGGRVDDLGRVDQRRATGQYDEVTWSIALDGATLSSHPTEYRAALVAALEQGMSDEAAEEHAYEAVATRYGY